MAKIKRSSAPEEPGFEPEADVLGPQEAPEDSGPVAVDSEAFFTEPGAQPSIYDILEGRVPPEEEGRTVVYDAVPGAGRPMQEGQTMIYHAEPPEEDGDYEDELGRRPIPKRGWLLVVLQAALSAGALFQLYRTQMLPTLFLGMAGVLLVLLLLLVFACQRYRVRGALARLFSLALCAALAVGCVFAQQGLAALSDVTSGLLAGPEARAIVKKPFVVYLSGVDTRGDLTDNARSDVNILAVVNPTAKRVALINTPRDYYVALAGTDSKDKLTHAGLYGVETSMATLGDLYGIEVDYYVRINFAGFMSIVDALGGVDVYSDYTFTSVGSPGYYDPTDFVEGWNHMDGQAALAFARERHAFASGDVQRGINQMKVIQAMLDKIKSPSLLLSYSRLMAALSDCFVTNLSSEQISALVRMQLGDGAQWEVESFSVTGSSSTSTKCYSAKGQKLYVMLPDEDSVGQAQALIEAVQSGEEAEEEDSAGSADAAA